MLLTQKIPVFPKCITSHLIYCFVVFFVCAVLCIGMGTARIVLLDLWKFHIHIYIYKWEKDESIKRNNKKIRVFSKPPLFFVYTIGQMQGKWL